MKEEPKEIDVEVLPRERPDEQNSKPGFNDPLVEFISRLLDSIFTIPGTKIRIGLDPLLGLIPGFGSPLSAFISLFLIARSAQHRVPRIVLARMALNVVINALLDAVPVIGDAISVFYRSNAMNYELLRKHAGTRASTKSDWLFVGVLLGGSALILLMAAIGFALVLLTVWHMLSAWKPSGA